MSERIAILFALEREAAPFRRLAAGRAGIQIAVSGVGANAARRTAEELTRRDRPAGVIMAGFCGALRPGLAVGDVVAASQVIDDESNFWNCAIVGQRPARLLTSTHLIATPSEKRALASRHDADIVDMESAAVAAVCQSRGVSFLAVRAVSDTVDTALSPRLVKLLSGASVSPLRAAFAVLMQPSLLGEFWRLARDTKLAAKQLAEVLLQHVRSHSDVVCEN